MARSCSVCEHPERQAIEAALRSGASVRDLAGRFGASKTALWRHATLHNKNKVVIESGQAHEGREGDNSMAKKAADTRNTGDRVEKPKGSLAKTRVEVVDAEAAVEAAQRQRVAIENERQTVERAIATLEQKLGQCGNAEAVHATSRELAEQRALFESLGVSVQNVVARIQRPALLRLEQARELEGYVGELARVARAELQHALETAAAARQRLADTQARVEHELELLGPMIAGLRARLALFTGEAEGGAQ